MDLHGADVTYGALEWSKQASRRTSSAAYRARRTVQRFATWAPTPAGVQTAAGARPHDPHLPRATRPQRERCGRHVSARHRERTGTCVAGPSLAQQQGCRATVRSRARVNHTSTSMARLPVSGCSCSKHSGSAKASQCGRALLSSNGGRLAQPAILRHGQRRASLRLPGALQLVSAPARSLPRTGPPRNAPAPGARRTGQRFDKPTPRARAERRRPGAAPHRIGAARWGLARELRRDGSCSCGAARGPAALDPRSSLGSSDSRTGRE